MGTPLQIISIKNNTASLSVNLLGGAITDFHLHNSINLLNFKNPPEAMPEYNRPGACYQGHFVCIGRWGAPSAGEIKAGLPHHGQAANLLWVEKIAANKTQIQMQVDTPLEGLQVKRLITLDDNNAVFKVTEDIKNVNPLGRIYNIVQHPTLAKPFLTADTVVNCNAGMGFNYKLNKKPLAHAAEWPYGIMEDGTKMNVSRPDKAYSSVFSFIVKKDAKFGWITAYSPQNNLLIGYLWQREQYAWISLWQDFDGENIRYRGLEFGTTGMHKPYNEVMDEGNHTVFGEASYHYIDAGEIQNRAYLGFMCKPPADFTEVANVDLTGGNIIIEETITAKQITIQTKLNADGISK